MRVCSSLHMNSKYLFPHPETKKQVPLKCFHKHVHANDIFDNHKMPILTNKLFVYYCQQYIEVGIVLSTHGRLFQKKFLKQNIYIVIEIFPISWVPFRNNLSMVLAVAWL